MTIGDTIRDIIADKSDYFAKFIKFGIVGFSGVAVDFSITYLLKEKANCQKYLANTVGFVVAASYNYLLNRIWTFNSHNQYVLTEYMSFMVVSMVGLSINTVTLWLLVRKDKNFYLAKLFAIAVTMAWNFTANLLFTFRG
ncbi:hypothetical protein GMLC_40230 [Geomonas limicola]|uniref:GtrA/DPMS transmembrane domain-containing protein n=1 Tax=Geomonas limicola TaxID=2740186 RepID=A0A6V8NF55_9BACT|nr:GtrA family protein [Geomonas limicola]GFO70444.1 hypothetical protein GMLC_40230 [Geomonas limicola]